MMTDEGYLIKSMDPDGTKHGVYGAEKHGYFEAVCNHDAMAFRVVDDVQARRIYDKIASIPGLRRHDVIITNCPGLDDTYADTSDWLWSFGTWVNGGHWTTAEARMILGYYRVGAYDDARRSMKHILSFAKQFRMDNNLTEFGSKPYQPKEPINCVYDTWGAPAALIRGLFEYLYRAEGLILMPHIPPAITRLEQRFPIRFGAKRLYLSTVGSGPVSGVRVNGEAWESFDGQSITLPYDKMPETARIQIALGGAEFPELSTSREETPSLFPGPEDALWEMEAYGKALSEGGPSGCSGTAKADLPAPCVPFSTIGTFYNSLVTAGFGDTYEAQHARITCEYMRAIQERLKMKAAGSLLPLPDASQCAADKSYWDTAVKLADGLSRTVSAYEGSGDSGKAMILSLWKESQK